MEFLNKIPWADWGPFFALDAAMVWIVWWVLREVFRRLDGMIEEHRAERAEWRQIMEKTDLAFAEALRNLTNNR